ncbi:MAG: hypothetical protein COA40_00850 [Aequorivita sp.]|nr:MAG: hypothetical protein COA40_00850 [Aequorivita sp.]
MKKMYFLFVIALSFGAAVEAQTLLWTDAMNYPLGPVHEGRWTSWSGNPGAEDLIMVNDGPPQMDSQVGYIGNPGQDAILQLDNQTSGGFIVTWFMHIPEDKTAYFNIQEDENPMGTGAWAVSVYFNEDGNTPGLGKIYDDNQNLLSTFNYGTGGVLFFRFDVNLNNDTIKFYQGDGSGDIAYEGPMYSNGGNLGAINFYRVNENTEFYLDTFQFWAVTLGTEEFASDVFKYSPNPVKDILNFNTQHVVDSIEIYDIMGRLVISEKVLAISPSIDTSNLIAGTYIAKVIIGDTSKTLRIIKK